jgi:excisionase family DNA binding protein
VPIDTIARPYVTTRELSDVAQVTDGYIRQLILAGKLKAEKAGGIWLIAREDAEGWMRSRVDIGQETSSNITEQTSSNITKQTSSNITEQTSSNITKQTSSNITEQTSSNPIEESNPVDNRRQ